MSKHNTLTSTAKVHNFEERIEVCNRLQHAMNDFRKYFPELSSNDEDFKIISTKLTEVSAKLTKIKLQMERRIKGTQRENN